MNYWWEPFYTNLFEKLRLATLKKSNAELLTLLEKNYRHFQKTEIAYKIALLLFEIEQFYNQKIIVKSLDQFLTCYAEFNVNLIPNLKIYRAVFYGNVRLVTSFLKTKAGNLKNPNWNLYLLVNCLFYLKHNRNRKKLLQVFIQYGLITAYSRRFDHNILHRLILLVKKDDYKAVEIAEILFNSGVSLHERSIENFSPMDYAVVKENLPLISFLLDKGVDINQGSHEGSSLLLAIRFCSVHTVEFLLSKGADFNNAKRSIGDTALHGACSEQDEKMISLLIRYGAVLSPENDDGETPFSQLTDTTYPQFYDCDSHYYRCRVLMVKEFSKLIFQKIPVSKKDVNLMQTFAQEIFEKCMAELQRMEETHFFASHSFFSVLKKSLNIEKLAFLMSNQELVLKFQANLQQFPVYKDDLQLIEQEANQLREKFEATISMLNSVYKGVFPDVVIRKVAKNLVLE